MPELPEVEAARKLAEKHLRGRQVRCVRTSNDPIVFDGVTPRAFAHALRTRRVLGVRRKGKNISGWNWTVALGRYFILA